jgi:hypothetical protein
MEMHAADEFSTSFDYASGATGERFQNPLWQLTELAFGRKLRSSISTVKRFGNVIVSNATSARKPLAGQKSEPKAMKTNDLDAISGSLINSLLESINDKQMVADAALNYLSAGKKPYSPCTLLY